MLSRRTESPRTILAFHATVIGILLTFALGATATLAWSGSMDWLIPWILGLGFLTASGYAGAVFWVAKDDPSKLMLGQVTGHEYAEIQRVVLGDSTTGERATPILDASVVADEPAIAEIAMERPIPTRRVVAEVIGERASESDDDKQEG